MHDSQQQELTEQSLNPADKVNNQAHLATYHIAWAPFQSSTYSALMLEGITINLQTSVEHDLMLLNAMGRHKRTRSTAMPVQLCDHSERATAEHMSIWIILLCPSLYIYVLCGQTKAMSSAKSSHNLVLMQNNRAMKTP